MAETIIQTEHSTNEEAERPTPAFTILSDTVEPALQSEEPLFQRPKRVELSEEEVLKRMEEFPLRKDKFVAAVREGKNRSIYP